MTGILPDVNIEGHFQILLRLLQQGHRAEFWAHMRLRTPTFGDLGLAADTPDVIVWGLCQREGLVLLTANRNYEGPDSLEAAIRTLNTPTSLPVLTLATPEHILHGREYAARVADRLLEMLFEIDRHLGAGRLFVP
ncbi:MAG TPA: hypothetical protein VFW33_21720 [Gemmataceae bacterium]|nr:hypothetical protein [Gemmataceae bacterium]